MDNDNLYHLSIAVPIVDPKELQLRLCANKLTVSRQDLSALRGRSIPFQCESPTTRFQRTIVLPDAVDAKKLCAEYKNGLFEITAALMTNDIVQGHGILNTIYTVTR